MWRLRASYQFNGHGQVSELTRLVTEVGSVLDLRIIHRPMKLDTQVHDIIDPGNIDRLRLGCIPDMTQRMMLLLNKLERL